MYKNRFDLKKFKETKNMLCEMKKKVNSKDIPFEIDHAFKNEFDTCHHCKDLYPADFLEKC